MKKMEKGCGDTNTDIVTISDFGNEKVDFKDGRESSFTKMRKLITVEPLLMIYYIAFQASLPIQQQMGYRKFLEHYTEEGSNMSVYNNNTSPFSNGSTGDQCENNEAGSAGQEQAQAASAMLSIGLGIASILPALFSTVFLGSFSDRAGRKWGMIPPFIGDIIKTLISMSILVFDLPFWQLLIIGSVVNGIMGNSMVVLNACFAYIADITTPKQRFLRIVVIEVIMGLSDMVANLSIGYLIKGIGFLYSYVFLLCLNVICLLYGIFVLKETVHRKPGVRLCSVENYTKSVRLYCQDKVPGQRSILLVCLLILMLQMMVEVGANGAALDLFFMNVPLCWESVALGYYRAILGVVRLSFSFIAARLLLPHTSANGLLMLGFASLIVYDLVLAQVTAQWIAYVALATSFGVGLISAMSRGITSQRVEPSEQGALFAGQGIAILLSSLAGNTMYNMIYSETVTTFSRTIFYVGAVQGAVASMFAGALYWLIRKHGLRRQETDDVTVRSEDNKACSIEQETSTWF